MQSLYQRSGLDIDNVSVVNFRLFDGTYPLNGPEFDKVISATTTLKYIVLGHPAMAPRHVEMNKYGEVEVSLTAYNISHADFATIINCLLGRCQVRLIVASLYEAVKTCAGILGAYEILKDQFDPIDAILYGKNGEGEEAD